jgi:hypothetical protein
MLHKENKTITSQGIFEIGGLTVKYMLLQFLFSFHKGGGQRAKFVVVGETSCSRQ